MSSVKQNPDKNIAKQISINRIARSILLSFALLTIIVTVSIIVSLFTNTVNFFRDVSITEFLFGTEWTPLFADAHYGVLPLIAGTLVVTLTAAFIALPLGLSSAIYLSEYANPKLAFKP